MSFIKDIINFVLPARCCICGKILDKDKGFCDECISKIEFLKSPICYKCGAPLFEQAVSTSNKLLCGNCLKHKRNTPFRIIRSASLYDDFSKRLILDFKFYDKTDLAPLLAKMLYVAGKDIFASGVDVIIPVPLHYTRLIQRRYNQSALLANELGKLTNIEVDLQILIKRKITKAQVECGGSERLTNVKGAFYLKDVNKLKNKRVLLIDDVLTTGATLNECAKTIKSAKPKSIDALTISRSII